LREKEDLEITDSGPYHSWTRGEFEINTDPGRIDLAMVYEFLTNSYWAGGVPREIVARSIQNSLCFGIYRGMQQVGFARAITDYATFAYVADVFVIQSYRGRGLGKWLMECIRSHPQLQGLRRWSLITRDAQDLYQQFGFVEVANPERWMEIHDPQVYERFRQGKS
jgi:GNAT superfamily N-acetyltransferase